MKSIIFHALAWSAVPAVIASSLPACSTKPVTPCKCPEGTQLSESVTVSVLGAAVGDVAAVVNDFYNSGWLGAVPFKTQGPNNKAGVSTRTSLFPTAIGVYNISELLYEYEVKHDGSFVQSFEQLPSTVPVEYHSNNGSFSGYWVTLEGTRIFEYETLIRWSVYACETGHVQDFAAFHEGALNNASSILSAQGKIKGINVDPVSAQAF
ncbi:hypothetical protein GGS24DRAFT_514340 [Hypoxylon argillaceum]|nr:hypothetical protein GGS24DRAFT_514340 [Hypoxylon argillaceum]KAI1149681.1 hypothetical protein F4825DRAFT_453215 [Nemania diffusa]